jgi:hypothetical protein
MKTHQPLGRTTIIAGAALAKQLFIGLTGALCAADAKPLGVSEIDCASGEQMPVIFAGIALVKSGAALSAGAKLEVDAAGKAITWATSGEIAGWALDAAGGADEVIRVLLA